MAYNCPNCGSQNTQSFRSVNESGTHSITHVTAGVTVGQTDLARYCAPPQEKSAGCAGCLTVILALAGANGLAIAGGYIWQELHKVPKHGHLASGPMATLIITGTMMSVVPLVMFLLGAFFAIRAYRTAREYNRDQFPQIYTRWERLMHCHRCGHDFLS